MKLGLIARHLLVSRENDEQLSTALTQLES
jgi:hypothetical protein